VYKVALVMQEYTQSGGVRSVFNYIKIINFKTVGKSKLFIPDPSVFFSFIDLDPDSNLN
jgi:hypothetical protein